MGKIFRDDGVTDYLSYFRRVLSLDISRKSTGVALYEEGVLKLFTISVDAKYSTTDALWEAKMKAEFRRYLTPLVENKHFDYIIIENTINGCNAITNKTLTLLNSVIDDMVLDKTCTVLQSNIIRVFPNVWRKNLKLVSPREHKIKDTKKLVEAHLLDLGFAHVLNHHNKPDILKQKEGYYDLLDAVGMLVGQLSRVVELDFKGR